MVLDGDRIVASFEGVRFTPIKKSMMTTLLTPKERPVSTETAKPVEDVCASQTTVTEGVPSKSAERHDFEEILTIIASELGIAVSELADDVYFDDVGVDSLLQSPS